jgi:hypothetical protein
MGMEEVSWFQRVLSVDTPSLFSSNLQNEINLHKFATNQTENLYYVSTFVFLILVPFLYDKVTAIKNTDYLSFFSPNRLLIFVSASFVAYNYDMWNIIFTQLCFFTTLFILIHYAWLSFKTGDRTVSPFLIVALYLATQISFLILGYRFLRIWDVTEYKEFLIPLAFSVYAIEVVTRARRLAVVHVKSN